MATAERISFITNLVHVVSREVPVVGRGGAEEYVGAQVVGAALALLAAAAVVLGFDGNGVARLKVGHSRANPSIFLKKKYSLLSFPRHVTYIFLNDLPYLSTTPAPSCPSTMGSLTIQSPIPPLT